MDGLEYMKLDLQEYMNHKLFTTEQSSLLLALRTRTIRGVRTDFGRQFADQTCPLPGCRESDSLPHILQCAVLRTEAGVASTEQHKYSDVFSPDIAVQKGITLAFSRLLETREQLLEVPALEEE